MNIKTVFQIECPRLKIDREWAREAVKFERRYVFSREENLEFLGAGLMGTPRFIFQSNWRHQFFDDVLKVDDDVILKENVHGLPHIDPSRRVSTDIFNLGCIYLVHRIITSSLSAREKEDAAMAILKVLHYKFLSSLMSHYFKYEPDRATAEATYYALNRKYSLKQHENWGNLITARSRDVLSSSSIHRRTLETMGDDEKVQYVVTDIQGRIREVVKKMYIVFDDIHRSQSKMLQTRSTIEIDGEVKLRDLVRKESGYVRYIKDVLNDRASLIKEELMKVVLSLVTTASRKDLTASLEYLVHNYGPRGDRRVEALVETTLHHAFVYMRSMTMRRPDLAMILADLKSLYMSSRTSNEHVLELRDLGTHIVSKATGSKNGSAIASIRTALLLYLVLRTMTKDHYSRGGTLMAVADESRPVIDLSDLDL